VSTKKLHLRQKKTINGSVRLVTSKSESNRALLIRALCNEPIELVNLSEARDTQTMRQLLEDRPQVFDVKDAGTTMRFLTAWLALHGEGQTITGTERMQHRPIGISVDALRKLGAQIDYQKSEGYPPMRISKIARQEASVLEVPGNISSQYISALLMIAPCLEQGLTVRFTTEIFSRPYIEMTLGLMKHFGVTGQWMENEIQINPQKYMRGSYAIESDWSGASYWYSLVAMNPENAELFLPGLRSDSFQGDSVIAKLMEKFGVQTRFEKGGALISKGGSVEKAQFIDFRNCPDLAQTVMVVAAVLGVELEMTGLESLRIKETDRIEAMRNELKKLGATLLEENNQWKLISGVLPEKIHVETYDDHRMAMAFAPLCTRIYVEIEGPDVVKKSYPNFWEDLASLG
jgi:3-phosphoshikimate 1-carboxyvinyltransferase